MSHAPAVAAHGLSTSLPLPDRPLDAGEWARLEREMAEANLWGHALAAVRGGELAVTEEQREVVEREHAAAMAAAVVLERELLDVAALLDGAGGIEIVVLKGPAVARLDYSHVWLRSFRDVDVLVRPRDVDRSIGLLCAAGYRRRFPEPRPGFDRRFGKGVCLLGRSGLEIDLHRTLCMGPFGLRVPIDELWRTPAEVAVGGVVLRALPAAGRALHAAVHAVLGDRPPRLTSLRDVAELTRDPAGDDELVATARSWGIEAVLASAVALTHDVLGLRSTALIEWAIATPIERCDRAALAATMGPGASYASRCLAAARDVPGLRRRAAFVWALAFPERRYVSTRHRGRVARMATAWAGARRVRTEMGVGAR